VRLFHKGKDGGPWSTVTGYWLVEFKRLFSIALLKFEQGSREEHHSHAFNCISWVLKGHLREEELGGKVTYHLPSFFPILTKRETFHRVFSLGTTWVFTVRGPWDKEWEEFNHKTGEFSTLRHGRVVVKKQGTSL